MQRNGDHGLVLIGVRRVEFLDKLLDFFKDGVRRRDHQGVRMAIDANCNPVRLVRSIPPATSSATATATKTAGATAPTGAPGAAAHHPLHHHRNTRARPTPSLLTLLALRGHQSIGVGVRSTSATSLAFA